MTPEEFATRRAKLGLTLNELAGKLECHFATVQRWEAGACRIPRVAEMALELLSQRKRKGGKDYRQAS